MPAGAEDLHQQVALSLAAVGQRYTSNRRALVDALASGDRPVTIAELRDRCALPLSSVYRNVTVLADAGVARRIVGADEFGRFELSEEVSGRHHHHVICSTCGVVADVAASPRLERALAEAARVASDESGFEVRGHRIDLLGRCSGCR